MKKRLFLAALILGGFLVTAQGCGGSGTIGTVCNAAVNALFTQCDQHNATDVNTIWNTLNPGIGIPVSAEEIRTATPGDVSSLCETALTDNQVEITDADAKAFVTAVNAATTCDEVASVIQQATY
jgi:hypothetical protein